MILSKNALAAMAAAALLLPAAASAHSDGLKLGQLEANDHLSMGLHLGLTLGEREHASSTLEREDRDSERTEHASSTRAFVASTTAARLSAKATRIISVADFMGSLSSNLSTRIASSSASASSTAVAQAKLGDFTANAASAKTEAQAALGLAAQLGSTTASTTVVSQAQADLKAARGFIRAAQQDLRQLLQFIFG